MNKDLVFDYSHALGFITEEEILALKPQAESAREKLVTKSGAGNDFLGWVDLPAQIDMEEYGRIKKAAEKIRSDSEYLVVIGIGGSYLGARAAIEFLCHSFYTLKGGTKILFAGNSVSTKYLTDLLDVIGDSDFSVNVISKSGTTTEPAIAFRVFKEKMELKYGREEAAKRIYATTDKQRGALKALADEEGYETYVVPDDIGGRFSVLTAVGLLPIAAAGCDTDALIEGFRLMRERCMSESFVNNPAMVYAAVRNVLYNKGKCVEVLANYEPSVHYIAEWWKQLYGESEGKDGKGIFPASVDLTTDLHSMGQYLQDGQRIMLETVIEVGDTGSELVCKEAAVDTDGLNYLAGKNMDFVNKAAMNGTILAHVEGGVPVLKVSIADNSAKTLGELFYFFEFACGISGYILDVNPFNQPGVESYKKNMFALLGKPGYEELRAKLAAAIKN